MSKNEENNKQSLWKGFGSFLTSVKDKTLKLVDEIQDKITELDESFSKNDEKEQIEFDTSLLPIIENSLTYIEEPINKEYKTFLDEFDLESKNEEIKLFMENSPNLRRIHSRLISPTFTEKEFWSRLFYKLKQRDEAQKISDKLNTTISQDDSNDEIESLGLTKEELEELENMEIDDEDLKDWE